MTMFLISDTSFANALDMKKINIINQKIFVKKDSHKSIIIGKQGEKIKQIGTRSRLDIEKLLCQQVYLKLEVFKKKKYS